MIRLGELFGDHMVLQREKPIRIWGTCGEDCEVRVSLLGKETSVQAKDGRWTAELPPMEAAAGAELRVSSREGSLCLQDVGIGEVWLAGGQSNMEFYLRYDAERREAGENPQVRFFDVPKISYEGETEDYDYSDFGFWRPCTRENLDYYSAAAYYFALRLQEDLQMPVG